MFSRSKIIESGDSEFIEGDVVENSELEIVNNDLKAAGKNLAEGKLLILGISEVSLSRKSFLSSVSFQHSVRMLINASLKGAADELKGLKENVIIGNLIPAGTNFKGSRKYEMIKEIQDAAQAELDRIAEEEFAEAEIRKADALAKEAELEKK